MVQRTQPGSRRIRRTIAGISAAVLLMFLPTAPVAIAQATDTATPPATGQDSNEQASTTAPATDPAPAPAPSPTPAPSPSPPSNTSTDEPTTIDAAAPAKTETANSASGATSQPTQSTQTAPNNNQTTTIRQNEKSTATSGNTNVTDNEKGGDAVSGNANTTATIVNVVNSSASGLGGSTPVTFVQDITGDIQGNITIDPASLQAVPNGTTTVNVAQNTTNLVDIENNVELQATSGNATVAGNEEAGNATSGDATALANIINLVSSSIGAKNSFLGVINIHGNLTGDILVPSSFVDSLLASNTSNPATTTTDMTDLPAGGSLTTNVNIANNVNLDARSGDASVLDNDEAGNATSGDASTNLTVFNLTGQQVVAKNSLLVFVNVLGEWVGMIVPAPAGSTAAALGGGVGSTGQTGQVAGDHESTVNITNNVDVRARSGNATVSNNEQAGDARSGNATAGANILNLVHSSYNLDDWFGALFINVLGSWLGNFDIARPDTPPGSQPVNPAQPDTPNTNSSSQAAARAAIRAVRVFQFNDDTTVQAAAPEPTTEQPTKPTPSTPSSGQVLGDSQEQPTPQTPVDDNGASFLALVAGLGLLVTLATLTIHRVRREAV